MMVMSVIRKAASFVLCIGAVTSLSGCGEKEKDVHPIEAVLKPGKITIVASKNHKEPHTDKFRTLDIKGQSQISYAPKGQEITEAVKNVQVVVASRNNPYASIHANILSKRLSKEFIVLCSACHDDYGNGVIGPSLIGKTDAEVLEMIDKYSAQPDANVLMTDLVHRMSREQIRFIVQDIARFNAEIAAENKEGKNAEWLKVLMPQKKEK